MLVASISLSEKSARAILSRYLWNVSPGLYIGGNSKLLERILEELKTLTHEEKSSVVIVRDDPAEFRHFRVFKSTKDDL